MTAYPVFHTYSYHAGELLRLKDSTQKNNKSALIHDFSFFMFLIIIFFIIMARSGGKLGRITAMFYMNVHVAFYPEQCSVASV